MLSDNKHRGVLPKGVLLVNLGTPDSPKPKSVRKYLAEFLRDPRVIDIPAVFRYLLLYLFILPFRPKKSAEAYKSIWTAKGSPLLIYSQELKDRLQDKLGDKIHVELAMRYGYPAIPTALEAFKSKGITEITVIPLYPQYSSASTGSSIEKILDTVKTWWNVPSLTFVDAFYSNKLFLHAFAEIARAHMAQHKPEFVLFSYHGLPERQIMKSDCNSTHCLKSPECCATIGANNSFCYRAQCYATSAGLCDLLGLKPGQFATSFQSRLGRTPWIKPYTDEILPEIYAKGVKRIAVMCPAFVADCLETLEEIGDRAAHEWKQLGGESLTLVPSLNADPNWVNALAEWVKEKNPALFV